MRLPTSAFAEGLMDVTAAATLIAWMDQELWLVTAQAGPRRGGLIATFVTPASIVADLPRMLVGLSRQHFTWELVEASNALALHLIGEQHLEWVWRFGLQSGREIDKLADLPYHLRSTGSPLLDDAIGWMDCRVEARLDTGDRTVYLAEVVESRVTNFAPPLTMRRLLELASPSRVTELKRQRHYDSLADAEAIRAWRRTQAGEERQLNGATGPAPHD
jgi:flavin reductase (DIM6/NTAB) family NADH-FMN oxidoreductase RutF